MNAPSEGTLAPQAANRGIGHGEGGDTEEQCNGLHQCVNPLEGKQESTAHSIVMTRAGE